MRSRRGGKKMAKGKKYRIPHRRRREGKTDYRARLKLIKSQLPRLVVRKSLNNIICQLVEFNEKGDKVLTYADSKELKRFGWKVNCGNIPAAYLTGMLCGLRAKKKKISKAVLDIGLYRSTKGSRLYAAMKGVIDAGISVPHSEEILPNEKRIKGAHIADYAKLLKSEKPSLYKKMFSAYLKTGVEPEKIREMFEATKKEIEKNI